MVAKKTSDTNESNIDSTVTENQQLRQELDEMKLLVRQLLEYQKANAIVENKSTEVSNVSSDDNLYQNIEDELNISPHKLVRVVSMMMGGLSLKGANGKEPVQFRDFGTSKTVTFEDVRAFVDNHHELAKDGGFIIQYEPAVKALYLDEDYKRLLSKEKIESLIDLPAQEIVNILKSVPKTLKETIIQRFIRGITTDNRYSDWAKMKTISDYVGEDLIEYAKQMQDG